MNASKRYKDIDMPYTCPETGRIFEHARGLSIYITKTLKISQSDYYDKYINHKDNSCFFCGVKGKFISATKGYRNLCENEACVKKSFSSCSIDGIRYKNMCSIEEAEILYKEELSNALIKRTKTVNKIKECNPLYDRERSRNCKEFWLKKGFTEEESLLKVDEVMDDIHKKTFKKFKENPEKYASKYQTKIEYYLEKGFSKEDALLELSKRQTTFSKELCIGKYGEEDGIKIWEKRQEKWIKSLGNNGNTRGGYSKISQKLFNELSNNIEHNDNIFYWEKNKEFLIKNTKSFYLYDFTDTFNKKIIEYNGDQFHANPNKYKPDDMPHPYHKKEGYTSKEIWEKDRIKIDLASKNGYDVLIIWDSEYKKFPEKTLQKCIDFING